MVQYWPVKAMLNTGELVSVGLELLRVLVDFLCDSVDINCVLDELCYTYIILC